MFRAMKERAALKARAKTALGNNSRLFYKLWPKVRRGELSIFDLRHNVHSLRDRARIQAAADAAGEGDAWD